MWLLIHLACWQQVSCCGGGGAFRLLLRQEWSSNESSSREIWAEIWSFTHKGSLQKKPKNPNFFLDVLGFFLKVLGKFWKWPGNAKKKNHFCVCVWGGWVVPCTVQYHTVQNCTVQQQNLVWKYFFCNSGWIRTYSLVSRCFWLTKKNPKKFGNFPNFPDPPPPLSLEISQILGFFLGQPKTPRN